MYVAKYVIYLHTGSVTVSASSSTFSNAVVINDVGVPACDGVCLGITGVLWVKDVLG